MSMNTRLTLDDAQKIATEFFQTTEAYLSLSPDFRRAITFGGTVESQIIKCSFYIPGERPELGTILMLLAVNRVDGTVSQLDLNEF